MAPITRSKSSAQAPRKGRSGDQVRDKALITPHRLRPRQLLKTTKPAIEKVISGRVAKSKCPAKDGVEVSTYKLLGHQWKQQPGSGLLSFPAELKNRIYEEVLQDGKFVLPIRARGRPPYFGLGSEPWRAPAVHMVCKQMRDATFSMYFSTRLFVVEVEGFEIAALVEWLKSIKSNCGSSVQLSVQTHLRKATWADVPELIPFLHYMRKLGFASGAQLPELQDRQDPEAKLIWRYVNAMQERLTTIPLWPSVLDYRCPLRTAIDTAVGLGRQAMMENWSEEWLDLELAQFLGERPQSDLIKKALDWNRKKAHRALVSARAHAFSTPWARSAARPN